jgi:DNA-binding response OmpR family regulator
VDVLVVEDDEAAAAIIERALFEAGHRPSVRHDGVAGLIEVEGHQFDLVILDVMLPELDGYTMCRELRRRSVHTPVLMLTARDSVPDRVAGLDAGADDYLTKPFALDELLARVRAFGRRRGQQPDSTELVVADLRLDPQRREASRGGRAIELTRREFDLLHYLMRNAGRVLTRQQITAEVWSGSSEATSNVVELYIHYLRNKVDRDTAWPLIRTIRGVGYMVDG